MVLPGTAIEFKLCPGLVGTLWGIKRPVKLINQAFNYFRVRLEKLDVLINAAAGSARLAKLWLKSATN